MNMGMNAYKILLWKAYFDKGLNLTKYALYCIGLFGLASSDVTSTLWLAVGYAIFCLVLGRVWFHYKLINVEHEVQNKVNPFVQEMREKFK